MKVYASPVNMPEPDYRNYDAALIAKQENDHMAATKKWLKDNGYNGKHTGDIVAFGVADGKAVYMMGDGKKSCLIHLPYGDAYHYRDVSFLPKKEIIKRLIQADKWAKLFA